MFEKEELSKQERIIADYVNDNASEVLREKIISNNYTIKGCYQYIVGKAQEAAKGSSSVMIDDNTVFGWAMHYFEDEAKGTPTPKAAPKVKKVVEERHKQISIFDDLF